MVLLFLSVAVSQGHRSCHVTVVTSSARRAPRPLEFVLASCCCHLRLNKHGSAKEAPPPEQPNRECGPQEFPDDDRLVTKDLEWMSDGFIYGLWPNPQSSQEQSPGFMIPTFQHVFFQSNLGFPAVP